VDITATDSEVVVIADLPGVQKADLGITIDRDELVIEAPVAGRADRESSLPWGFYRRFRLRTLVDRDRIGAHLEGGVARVVLPKSAAEKAKKVAVD
jgi:HSP20 family protein